ncbi:MAG: hypothetical protein ACPGRD_06425, partial [Planktomarina sp.]
MNKVLGFWLRYVGGVLAVAIWAYGVAVLAAVLLPPDMLVQSIFLVIAFPMVIVGVAVVFVPQVLGAPVSGATYWLMRDKALIQLSLRH